MNSRRHPRVEQKQSLRRTAELGQRQTFNQTANKECLIIYLVSNSHQKGSEAVYPNIYNRIIKNNNSSNNNNNSKKNTLRSVVCGGLNEKEIQRRGYICMCIADSLCCTAETDTTLNNYTPMKNFLRKNTIHMGPAPHWARHIAGPLFCRVSENSDNHSLQ